MNARARRRSVLVSAGGAGVELTASISELQKIDATKKFPFTLTRPALTALLVGTIVT